MSARAATHAGSWYPESEQSLRSQLESFIKETDPANHNVEGCRIIISPHAGYSYSGPTAAYGFKALNWAKIKRVFILGPSHHFYLKGCALSRCRTYKTPLGELDIDTGTIKELASTGHFDDMSLSVDEDEHSIEMQLPFLRLVMPRGHSVPLVPILVGNLDFEREVQYGRLLSGYLQDESNMFVISSDFCHWGDRFGYRHYKAPNSAATSRVSASSLVTGCPIWKSIEDTDREGMRLIEAGSHKGFAQYLETTKNTICGRHPISVILAATETAALGGKFHFLDYRQSNRVTDPVDGSVSYASGILLP